MQFILKLSRNGLKRDNLRISIKERYAPQWDSTNYPFDEITTGLSDEKFIEELVRTLFKRIIGPSFDLHINKIDFHSKINLLENKFGAESHDLSEPDWNVNNYYLLTFDILAKAEEIIADFDNV